LNEADVTEQPMEPIYQQPATVRRRWRIVTGAVVVAVALAGATALVIARDDPTPRTTGPTAARVHRAAAALTATVPVGAAPGNPVAPDPAPAGCRGPAPVPSGPANRMKIADVDGDGRRDTAWAASTRNGGRELGIVTAAAGGDQVAISLDGPTAMWVMAADADHEPPLELFVGDTRSVQLWTFVDCALRPVTDRQGEPYVFDRGFVGTGTGAGCIDADGDGRRDLVGLNVIRSDETVVEWSRTIIERDGLLATNGATDTGRFNLPADQARVGLLFDFTCGDPTTPIVSQPE
jgi:hypothetical protein